MTDSKERQARDLLYDYFETCMTGANSDDWAQEYEFITYDPIHERFDILLGDVYARKPFPHGKWPVRFGEVAQNFDMSKANAMDLEGAPHSVYGYFECDTNLRLSSLRGIPTFVEGWLILPYNPNLGLLWICNVSHARRCFIKADASILPPTQLKLLNQIIGKYISRGYAGMVPFARELIRAGFKGNARL
jgi:hypothetical protein